MALRSTGGNELKPARIKAIKLRVFGRDNWTCVRCFWTPPPERIHLQIGTPSEDKGVIYLTLDHIIPLSKGGHPNRLDNLQTMCNVCNREKGNTT
jgi:5-methylcytosine-specific restriction endonuclease McrA